MDYGLSMWGMRLFPEEICGQYSVVLRRSFSVRFEVVRQYVWFVGLVQFEYYHACPNGGFEL